MRAICTLTLLLATAAPALADDALAPLPDDRWDVPAAAHLMRRAGFGGSPEQIVALAAMPHAEAVDIFVDYQRQPAEPPLALHQRSEAELDRAIRARIDAHLTHVRRFQAAQLRQQGRDPRLIDSPQLTRQRQRLAENRAVGEVTNRDDQLRLRQLRAWWLSRMLTSSRPLEEKMTLFWHGHFTSGYETVRSAVTMQRQNALLRRHATGSFRALLRGVLRDAAMLRYLDGFANVKNQPNENLARELLELFTLGRGHYTETDIRETARALTGWRLAGDQVVYNRYLHDYGRKTVFGQSGRYGPDEIVELILARDACAQWIARRVARWLVADEPPAPLVAGWPAS